MIWFILALIISMVIIITLSIDCIKDEYLGFWGKVGSIIFISFISLSFSFLLAGFISLMSGVIIYPGSNAIDHTETKSIVLMSDNIEAQGQWSLFGGSVASEGKFYFYVEKDGEITLESVEAEYASIREDSSSPYLEATYYTSKLKFWGATFHADDKYVFHIPEGSINHSIKLDGE